MAEIHYNRPDGPIAYRPGRSVPSILSIVCALGSFFVHSGVFGLLLAVAAVALGAVGFFLAASPRVSGGILSLVAIVLGLIGTVFAVLRGIMHLF